MSATTHHEIAFAAAKIGMAVRLKDKDCVVTQVKILKGKTVTQPSKVKITGRTAAGSIVSVTKPEDRMLEVSTPVVGTAASSSAAACASDSDDAEITDAGACEQKMFDAADLLVDCSDAGASCTAPVRCGELRKGHFVVMRGEHPCKVLCIDVAQPGKHGHTKATITGVDVFTGRKYIEVGVPSDHTLRAPVLTRSEWQLTDLDQDPQQGCGAGRMTLMGEGGDLREDLDLPTLGGLGERIAEAAATVQEDGDGSRAVFVTVLGAMDHEQVVDFRVKDAE